MSSISNTFKAFASKTVINLPDAVLGSKTLGPLLIDWYQNTGNYQLPVDQTVVHKEYPHGPDYYSAKVIKGYSHEDLRGDMYLTQNNDDGQLGTYPKWLIERMFQKGPGSAVKAATHEIIGAIESTGKHTGQTITEVNMVDYVPVSANKEHIDRHFAGSLVPGSKFFPMSADAQEQIINTVDTHLAERFQQFLDKGETPSRVVMKIEFPHDIGTDALVQRTPGEEGQFVEVTRDPGTANEAKVNIKESSRIPTTGIVTVIAGPYGPSGKWGIYTMFPGQEAPPFPNADRQNTEALQANQKFWTEHGFLATPEEMQASLAAATPVQNAPASAVPKPVVA